MRMLVRSACSPGCGSPADIDPSQEIFIGSICLRPVEIWDGLVCYSINGGQASIALYPQVAIITRHRGRTILVPRDDCADRHNAGRSFPGCISVPESIRVCICAGVKAF